MAERDTYSLIPFTPSDSFVFATVERDLYDVRYHVPRSQVWEGSRGGQRGNVHLHVKTAFHLGRIHRNTGESLCGKSGWFERPLDELEVAAACPRCTGIELRRREASAREGASPTGVAACA